jgi:hypothetical protein
MKTRIMLGLLVVAALTAIVLTGADALPAAMTADDEFVCDDSFRGVTINGDVVVSLEAECSFRDSVIHGNIRIVQGGINPLRFGTLNLRNTEVHGDIRHSGSDVIDINNDSIIHGSVHNLFNSNFRRTGGRTSIDDSTVHGDVISVRTERVDIDSSFIGGNVKIENPEVTVERDERVRITDSIINLTVELNNNAEIQVTDNVIGGDLLCQNNDDVDVEDNDVGGTIDCDGASN